MRAFDWGCVAVVCAAIGVAAACGGRLQVADCGAGAVYCAASDVCCPTGTVCGTGDNGCPARGCCSASYIARSDGGAPAAGTAQQGFSPEPSAPPEANPPPPASGTARHPDLQ